MYSLLICIYKLIIKFASLFNDKARLMNNGHKDLFIRMKNTINDIKTSKGENVKTYLFHCASLGEFEQGRPLIEALRSKEPDSIILLTFFSPSGYEPNKSYSIVDAVFYLPYDTKWDAKKFAEIIKIDIAVIIKYEYWRNIFKALHNNGTSIYIVSAIFQKDMYFFKSFGSFFRYPLKFVSHFFVQDNNSKLLLDSIGFSNVTVTGDTRFDRVIQITKMETPKRVTALQKFINPGKRVFVAGSVWPSDMKRLIPFISSHNDIQFLIAPHNIDQMQIDKWISSLPIQMNIARFTDIEDTEDKTYYDIIFIDCIGILSQIYKFASLTFIGGGYDRLGIHNVLEPAVWYKPIIFGPVYSRFIEAVELVNRRGAHVVNKVKDIESYWQLFLKEGETHAKLAGDFVFESAGCTEKILKFMRNMKSHVI